MNNNIQKLSIYYNLSFRILDFSTKEHARMRKELITVNRNFIETHCEAGLIFRELQ